MQNFLSSKLRTFMQATIIIYMGALSCNKDEDLNDIKGPMVDFTPLQLFTQAHTDGNSFSCNSCHARKDPADDGMVRAGHDLENAYNRSSFKNGQLSTLLAAVNSCRQEWMNAPAFTTEQIAWTNLESFLKDLSEGQDSSPISFEINQAPSDLSGGDADTGMKTFNNSCSICHGANGVGSIQGPGIAGTSLTGEEIAKRIRTSGSQASDVYDGLTGGKMPFFTADRLEDKDLRDIIAFLQGSEAETETANTGESRVDLSLTNPSSDCGSDHSLVGTSLTFSTKYHQVSGTATVIDNCTIHFDNFNFDGQGINVRVYTGSDGDFGSGKIISKDMLGTPFNDGSASLILPEGTSLDDFNSLSIWCVPIGISFGDGTFQ
ncbi:MAG: DM13 domain-containing protein [Oligoflexales bacterium]